MMIEERERENIFSIHYLTYSLTYQNNAWKKCLFKKKRKEEEDVIDAADTDANKITSE